MLCCNACKVQIAGDLPCCPLCGGPLTGEKDPAGASFPDIPQRRSGLAYLFSWLTFGAVAAALVCIAIDVVVAGGMGWSLFAVAGIACAWVSLAIALAKKTNLLKSILWELILVTALAIAWDTATGWHGWSVEFVMPCSCVAVMLSMFVLHKALHLPAKDYIIYLILDVVFGILPAVFLLTGLADIWLPSLICIGCSLLLLAGLLLFQGHAIRHEISKKLHM